MTQHKALAVDDTHINENGVMPRLTASDTRLINGTKFEIQKIVEQIGEVWGASKIDRTQTTITDYDNKVVSKNMRALKKAAQIDKINVKQKPNISLTIS